jgi:hypothetical protein
MRYILANALAMVLAGVTPCNAHAQIEGPLTALILGKALDNFADRLEGIVGQATKSGDFLVEKNARLLHGVVADARIQLEEVLDKTVGELKLEHRNFLATLNTAVEEIAVKGPIRLLELQDFLALDLENIVRQMPGRISLFGKTSEKLSFRRLDGYSQVYQKDGVYSFRFIGAAFGPDFRSTVTVNGTKVKLLDMRTPRAYVLEFDVPVQALNEKFSDGKVERVDIQVESFAEDKKPVFSYKNQVLLLPKSPVSVKVTERYKAKEWSKESYTSEEGATAMPALGHYPKDDRDHVVVQVSASIPPGCLMLKDTVAVRFEPASAAPWSRQEGAARFTREDQVASVTYHHWIEKFGGTAYIKVNYKKPEVVTKEREVAVGTKVDGKNLIPFGSTIASFSPEYEGFTLEAKWFNGREATLTPTQLNRPGIKVSLETSSPPRLLLDMAWPEFGNKP